MLSELMRFLVKSMILKEGINVTPCESVVILADLTETHGLVSS